MQIWVVMDEDGVPILGPPAVAIDDAQPERDGEVVGRHDRPRREGEEVADVPGRERPRLRLGPRTADVDRNEVLLPRLDADTVLHRVPV